MPRPRGYKTFSYATQLSTIFILLINIKLPTEVGILTFSSMINTTSERERNGSVGECLTRDRGAAGSSLAGVTALCP